MVTFANVADASVTSPFIDLTARVVSGGERGLLGMAFDPQFATNGRVFLNYTRGTASLQTVIASYVSRDGGLTLDPSSEEVLLTVDQPFSNHNGGNLVFGPDGLLYAGLGDGGSSGDPQDNAQNTRTLLGKMLRIDVSAGTGYTIPASNPFAGKQPLYDRQRQRALPRDFRVRLPQSVALQLRSRHGRALGRRRRSGRVGRSRPRRCRRQLRLALPRGRALLRAGQRLPDGARRSAAHRSRRGVRSRHRASRSPAATSIAARRTRRSWAATCSPTSSRDACSRTIPGSSSLAPVTLAQTSLSIASFAQDVDGELYVVDYSGGLQRIEQPTGGDDTIPALLSETGCVSAGDATQPSAGLIPYAPNAEFWSDGADKTRWLGLPDGQNITVTARRRLGFRRRVRCSSRTSRCRRRLVETRLLMRHPDGVWAGYTL